MSMDTQVLLQDLRAAALLLDELKLAAIVDCCCEWFPLKRVCLDLIIPVMAILELEQSLKNIASFAEGVILLCLRDRAKFILPFKPSAPIIISGSVPFQDNELHGFIVSLLLASDGYRVIHVESNSTFESLLSAVDVHNASAIVLHTKKHNQRSANVLQELFGYLGSAEYERSFVRYHKFVRKPQLFLSGEHKLGIPSTIHITLEDVGTLSSRKLVVKEIVRVKNNMMNSTNDLISASCAKMRLSYTRLGVREGAADVIIIPRHPDVVL